MRTWEEQVASIVGQLVVGSNFEVAPDHQQIIIMVNPDYDPVEIARKIRRDLSLSGAFGCESWGITVDVPAHRITIDRRTVDYKALYDLLVEALCSA